MRKLAAEGEHPTGLAAIRLMLLTGFRRMEVLGLERSWINRPDYCVRFPDTKSGAQIRVLGAAALTCIDAAPGREGSAFVFPADWGEGHFVGSCAFWTASVPKRNSATSPRTCCATPLPAWLET